MVHPPAAAPGSGPRGGRGGDRPGEGGESEPGGEYVFTASGSTSVMPMCSGHQRCSLAPFTARLAETAPFSEPTLASALAAFPSLDDATAAAASAQELGASNEDIYRGLLKMSDQEYMSPGVLTTSPPATAPAPAYSR